MHISAESVCRSVFAPDLIATNYKKLKSYLKTDKQKCERNHLKQPKNHLKGLKDALAMLKTASSMHIWKQSTNRLNVTKSLLRKF